MSLRLRLFLGLSGLLAVMVTAQWWWVRGLTRELSDEVGFVAFEVGSSMASLFLTDCPDGETCPGADDDAGDEVFVHRTEPPAVGYTAGYSTGSTTTEQTFDVVLAPSPEPRRSFVFRKETKTVEDAAEDTTESATWVGVQQGDEPPEWLQVPAGAERVHWVGTDGEPGETHQVKLHKSFVFRTDETTGEAPSRIVVSLDTEHEDPAETATVDGTGSGRKGSFVNDFFFSDKEPQAAYISVLATGDDVRRRIPIPSEGLQGKIEDYRRRMLWGSLVIFGIGLVLSALVAQRVSAPLRRLAGAAREVGEGSLGKQVPVAAPGEVGQAIHAFNRMSSELESYDRKTRQLQAREHLGEIGEIARGLAHTLRNPLNALGLSVEELAAQAPGEAAGLASSARRQIRRIDQSIRSFLALASQGGGMVSEVAPGELVQDVALEALQDARGSRNGSQDSGSQDGSVKVDVEVDDGAPTLRAVEPELRAVLQALLVNAVEASPAGGTVSIRVRATEGPEPRVRIEVDDQGPGLPKEVRERLFTPHLTTKANGSGMGLFLAHRIATNRYGGRLELEDRCNGQDSKGSQDSGQGGTRAVLEIGPRNQELRHG